MANLGIAMILEIRLFPKTYHLIHFLSVGVGVDSLQCFFGLLIQDQQFQKGNKMGTRFL